MNEAQLDQLMFEHRLSLVYDVSWDGDKPAAFIDFDRANDPDVKKCVEAVVEEGVVELEIADKGIILVPVEK